jgi:hypothetical protein
VNETSLQFESLRTQQTRYVLWYFGSCIHRSFPSPHCGSGSHPFSAISHEDPPDRGRSPLIHPRCIDHHQSTSLQLSGVRASLLIIYVPFYSTGTPTTLSIWTESGDFSLIVSPTSRWTTRRRQMRANMYVMYMARKDTYLASRGSNTASSSY